jgi:hypothetical protein
MARQRYKKIESVTDEDYKKNAYNLHRRYGDKIHDEKSFDVYFRKYFNKSESSHIAEDENWEKNVYRYYSGEKKAKASEIGISRREQKEFRERRGQETFRGPVKKRIIRERGQPKKTYMFTFIGTQKGQKNYARQIKTMRGVRYIDSRGRFVSVKKK